MAEFRDRWRLFSDFPEPGVAAPEPGDDPIAIHIDLGIPDGCAVAQRLAPWLTLAVPHAGSLITRGRDDVLSIGAVAGVEDEIVVAHGRTLQAARFPIPHPRGKILRSRKQPLFVGAELGRIVFPAAAALRHAPLEFRRARVEEIAVRDEDLTAVGSEDGAPVRASSDRGA